MKNRILQPALLCAAALFAITAQADAGHEHGGAHAAAHAHDADTPYGRPGDAAKAQRTVRIVMSDTMRFDPATITVRRGETVRFVAANGGRIEHEFVLGTTASLKAHAEEMRAMPDMQHADPGAVRVAAGASGEIVWQFTEAGSFEFGCLIPGHFEAGMVGKVVVR
ncbi:MULTISPECIES: plastocyanin/azurin family copper-binding protein [unclassified Rubrivivax]|uniref:copper-resistant cuproprotein CopI n=1 Tax=unclassified Rubrivivax TaxID=2649762 RepID=UPI001E5549CA|nr:MULTISPECIES: cupredoxin family protein [unclassified Rubrivivax]MCC9598355.1 cupredoxin family protein [Rubrivivax sp. JA1055]MCC9645389.1 cupredoxin family protein [Rubrivivax sp. JA1029]